MNIQNMMDYVSFRVATRYLKRHHLYDEVMELIARHKSTGVSLIDFAVLHEFIRNHKPQYVLECGTGLSTHIIAAAMEKFCKPLFDEIKLISMESEQKWHEEALLQFDFNRYTFTEIILSRTTEYRYSFVNGVIYADTPEYPYDFVFVDGPQYGDSCDMDFIKVVQKSKKKVSALIDSRRTSGLAYCAVLGRDKLLYFPFGFSLVSNVTKEDLILSSKKGLHHSFSQNIPKSYGMFVKGVVASILLCFLPMRWCD